ncbi:MAG TPA: hypothetical protein VGK59_11370 [Ohtaekwangia sp.]
MRQLISISLIALLLFNVMGYYGLFLGLNYQNKQSIIQRLDVADYQESQTVTIKIPMAIPYASGSENYERVDGEFEHEGEFYHMVKQRHFEDTLYIVCIKDDQSKRIDQAMTDYVKTFTDKPVDGKNTEKMTITFIKEYMTSSCVIRHVSSGWSLEVSNPSAVATFENSYTPSFVHPPERA